MEKILSLERTKKNGVFFGYLLAYSYLCSIKDKNDMIATSQTTTNQKAKATTTRERVMAKATTTRERVMASTVSVDEYFDELISQVHQDYAEL